MCCQLNRGRPRFHSRAQGLCARSTRPVIGSRSSAVNSTGPLSAAKSATTACARRRDPPLASPACTPGNQRSGGRSSCCRSSAASVRSRSVTADIAGQVANGEGFGRPAPRWRVVRSARPGFESLPRRKPRAGRSAVTEKVSDAGPLLEGRAVGRVGVRAFHGGNRAPEP
jgi:hypothetical protein